jgi:hypothetical protein
MRYLKFFIFMIFIQSCSHVNVSPNIEAEDIRYITGKTAKYLEECYKFSEEKSCRMACEEIEKNSWLLTRKVSVTNMKGMRENEWEISLISIQKDLKNIDKYSNSLKGNCPTIDDVAKGVSSATAK